MLISFLCWILLASWCKVAASHVCRLLLSFQEKERLLLPLYFTLRRFNSLGRSVSITVPFGLLFVTRERGDTAMQLCNDSIRRRWLLPPAAVRLFSRERCPFAGDRHPRSAGRQNPILSPAAIPRARRPDQVAGSPSLGRRSRRPNSRAVYCRCEQMLSDSGAPDVSV